MTDRSRYTLYRFLHTHASLALQSLNNTSLEDPSIVSSRLRLERLQDMLMSLIELKDPHPDIHTIDKVPFSLRSAIQSALADTYRILTPTDISLACSVPATVPDSMIGDPWIFKRIIYGITKWLALNHLNHKPTLSLVLREMTSSGSIILNLSAALYSEKTEHVACFHHLSEALSATTLAQKIAFITNHTSEDNISLIESLCLIEKMGGNAQLVRSSNGLVRSLDLEITLSIEERNVNPLPPTTAYRDWETDRKSTRLNSSHSAKSRMPSSA